MNLFNVMTWSERQQVLAVILMAGVLIFALWFFASTPMNAQPAPGREGRLKTCGPSWRPRTTTWEKKS